MILATTTVEDVDDSESVRTQGPNKRALHGSKGSTVFRDPTEENRCGCSSSGTKRGGRTSVDPEVPPILKEAGHLGKPQTAPLLGQYRA